MNPSMDLPAARPMSVSWLFSGACADKDPELFFPIGVTGPALRQIEQAKEVCRSCSVLDECRRWALDTRQNSGVWGGLSEDERRSMQARRIGRPRKVSVPRGR